MSEYIADKIHAATPHRRQLARREGRVAKSHDLAAAVVLLAALAVLLYGGSQVGDVFGRYARQQLGGQAWLAVDADFAVAAWHTTVRVIGRAVAPLIGVLLLLAAGGHLAQTGLLIQPQRIVPDMTRINPASGFGRLLSTGNLARLVFALLKILFIIGVAAWCLWSERVRVVTLGNLPPAAMAAGLVEIALWCGLKMAGAMLLLGVVDYGFQRWRLEQSLRMTTEEMREELRNQQGDPSIHRRRKQLQRQLLLAGMEKAVDDADLIIAHGTKLAVALRFDPQTMVAPLVVAKGARDAAARICSLAAHRGARIHEDRRLARQLYRQIPVKGSIGPQHYQAVARLWSGKGGRTVDGTRPSTRTPSARTRIHARG
jgi:flagellar biosynthetic protein FlhB